MVKVSVLIKRKDGMSPAEFHDYWRNKHGPLALTVTDFISHFRRYVQCHQVPQDELKALPSHTVSEYDGIVELWADSVEDVAQAFASKGYQEVIRRDERNFSDDSKGVICMVTEDVVIKR